MGQYNQALVKPNGYVMIFSTIRENADVGYYIVKDVKMLDLALQRKGVLEAMQSCRYIITRGNPSMFTTATLISLSLFCRKVFMRIEFLCTNLYEPSFCWFNL